MSQIVIVTGGSRGIGAATARLLGREKAAVVVNYRNAKAEADAVVRDIEASGGKAIAVQGDVGNEDDILRLFAETDRVFGALTGLVNNAGITGGTQASHRGADVRRHHGDDARQRRRDSCSARARR